MNLLDCLSSLQGYGVALLNKSGRLVIQSVNLTLDDQQKFILKSHKPLLLTILPIGGTAYPVGVVLDAVEAYEERLAIMQVENIPLTSIEPIALQQARQLLSPTVSQT